MNKVIYNNKTNKFHIVGGDNNLLYHEDMINEVDFSKLPKNVLENPSIYLSTDYELFEFDIEKIKLKFFNLKPSNSDISSKTVYKNSEDYGFCIYEHTRVISIIRNLFTFLSEFQLSFLDFNEIRIFENFVKSLIRKEYKF